MRRSILRTPRETDRGTGHGKGNVEGKMTAASVLRWVALAWAFTCLAIAEASYGLKCSKDSDCNEEAPICSIYFEDFSARVRAW